MCAPELNGETVDLILQEFDSTQHRGQEPLDLMLATAGKKPEDHSRRRSGARRVAEGRLLEKRVPDEVDVDAACPVELDLEREDDGHAIHAGRYLLHPPLAPCPDLRADVVEDTHSDPSEPTCQYEIETGVVNQNGQAHVPLGRESNEAIHGASQAWDVSQDLHQAHHREVVAVIDELTAGLAHPVTAHTEYIERGVELAKPRDDLGRVQVAGGLTRDHEHRVSSTGHRSLRYPMHAPETSEPLGGGARLAAAKARPG